MNQAEITITQFQVVADKDASTVLCQYSNDPHFADFIFDVQDTHGSYLHAICLDHLNDLVTNRPELKSGLLKALLAHQADPNTHSLRSVQ